VSRTPATTITKGGTAGAWSPPSLPTSAIEARLAAFERRDNATATAFDWRFTATDLDESLARIDGHDKRRSRRPPDPHELPARTA